MATFDKMIVDDRDLANRYFGENNLNDFDNDQFLFSKPNQSGFNLKPMTKQDLNNKDDDLSGLFGRRVYLESPSFDNKEEEDMYRYVPSRLSEVPISVIHATAPNVTADTLIDSLDFELDLIGATNTRHGIPYQTNGHLLKDVKPPEPLTNPSKSAPMTNTQRADPRQDPLLGPLLAELDAMTTQQQYVPRAPAAPAPSYRRNSVPYKPTGTRPPVSSQSNYGLTSTANRTVNDALFEAELYDSLDPRDQPIPPIQERQHVPFSAPNINSSNNPQQQQQRLPARPVNMNNIDVFMPQSYDTGPGLFSNQFASHDQLFQQPLLNALGQNYVPNPNPSPPQQQQQPQYEQRDKSFDDIYSRMSPPHRSAYIPSQQLQNNNSQYQQQPPPPPSHHLQQQQDPAFDDLYSQMSPQHRTTYIQPQQPQNNNQYQLQPPPPPPNRQTTYNNNNNNIDPFSEFQDNYASTQYRRPSQVPLQQRPSPSQQQTMMPPPPPPSFQQPRFIIPTPPSSQQPRTMPPPPPSYQQPRMMPPAPPSFQQQTMMPPPPQPSYQQQTMMPPSPSSYQQPRMMPPPPPSFQQPRMMPPLPPSSQQPRTMPPPPPSSQQPRTMPPPPPFSQQQQYQKPSPSTQQQEEYQRSPPTPQQQYYEDEILHPTDPSNNQDMFFTDINDDQFDQISYQQQPQQPSSMTNQNNVDQQEDQDAKRQAIWNELQRTNVKVQEKNAKKRESANRREQMLKGTYTSSNIWNSNSSKQSSAQSKTGGHSPLLRRPPPMPVSKTNYVEDNIEMIKNKENFYHRYPAKKYENLYSKRKDLFGGGNNNQQNGNQNTNNNFDQTPSSTSINNPTATYSDTEHRSNLPVSINLHPADHSQSETLPATVSIPLDSHVTRVGDKISVNIDVRLVDLQNLKQQQNNGHPDWSSLDPLDRHIRKLETSIDRSLPTTHSPTQRSPTLSHPIVNASMGRYGKQTIGTGQGGYAPPNHKNDYYSYSAKGREEDSYLSKMTQVKKPTYYKPYTGRDYEQFKKNYGFGTSNLGFDYDNPEYKEKSDKLSKTKEYAQQIEARNKKKLAEAPRRTLSETRKPQSEPSTTQRALEYARVSTRHKLPIGSATHSSPADTDEPAPLRRRPTEVPHPPPPIQKQATKIPQNNDNELVERLAMRHERDKAQVQGILNPSQKRREQLFDDDDRRISDIEKLAQDRANQRRLSPPKLPPTGPTNNGNARRPLRFDNPILPDEPTQPPQQQYRPVQQQSAQQQPPQQQYRPVQQQSAQQQPAQRQPTPQQQPVQQHNTIPQPQTNVDQLANRHKDEKVLMEAIRQELSERPLDDDEELVVVEQ